MTDRSSASSGLPQIVLFDPAAGSSNLGDEVIAQAVERELRAILGNVFVIRVSIHQGLRDAQRRFLADAALVAVAGSNMLNLRSWPLRGENRWKVAYEESRHMHDVVLFGVGWAGYRHRPNAFGVRFYRKVLAANTLHSVRDEFTRGQLQSHDLPPAVCTACPTMWQLTPGHLAAVPAEQAPDVVTTLTDYARDAERDRRMLACLREKYRNVYLWPQGSGDAAYATSLGHGDIEVLEASLAAFDSFLSSSDDVEYCGTRLHGGIRALQHRRRAIILAIDNRAVELGSTTGLPVVAADEVHRLDEIVKSKVSYEGVQLPTDAIEAFRASLRRHVFGREADDRPG